jgi:hypothetical protein
MTNEELAVLKTELTNDPLDLGLTLLEADDVSNADKLNEIRESVQVFRASVPSDEILIPVDEWNGLSSGQQSWWNNQTADGSVKPAVIESEFNKLFAAGTVARANFASVSKEPSSRAIQLFERYVNITPSDVANARNLP